MREHVRFFRVHPIALHEQLLESIDPREKIPRAGGAFGGSPAHLDVNGIRMCAPSAALPIPRGRTRRAQCDPAAALDRDILIQ